MQLDEQRRNHTKAELINTELILQGNIQLSVFVKEVDLSKCFQSMRELFIRWELIALSVALK